jgi:ferritin-like metal-binding protein YciE
MKNIRELLIHELEDTLHAEKQLIKTLPKMVEAASSADLSRAFQSHFEETQKQVTRLEQVFAQIEEPVKARKCHGMAGILEEGTKLLREAAEDSVRDAGLICSAQKVEHYEIASYGCLCAWAELLDEEVVLALLKESLAEEKAADQALSDLAESTVNPEAKMGEDSAESHGRHRRQMVRG